MKRYLKFIWALSMEYMHRELFDHYYVHPDFIHKDLRILPKWKYHLYECIFRLNRTWRYNFHDLADFIKHRAPRYQDNREIYQINVDQNNKTQTE